MEKNITTRDIRYLTIAFITDGADLSSSSSLLLRMSLFFTIESILDYEEICARVPLCFYNPFF